MRDENGAGMAMRGSAASAAEGGGSLAEHAYHALLGMILGATFAGGDPIQERRLAEQLGISRTPVREALGRLQREGLLTADGSGSMRVAQIGITEFAEILNMRRLLEVEAAGLAANKGVTPRDAEPARQAISRFGRQAAPSPMDVWAMDDEVHGLVARAAQSRLLAASILDLRRRGHIFDAGRPLQSVADSAHEHLSIVQAVLAGDEAGARAAMERHLVNVKNAVMDQVINHGRAR